MRVWTSVERSVRLHGSKPLFVLVENKNGRTEEVVVTYQEAWEAGQHHAAWLQRQVETELIQQSHASDDSPVHVVVAYVSNNSPDLFLSVVAATEIRSRPTILCMPHPNHDHTHDSDSTMIYTALLNARWTPHEMAQALQVRNDNSTETQSNSSPKMTQRHVTILVYGHGYRDTAEQAASLLRNETPLTTHESLHFARAVALPTYTIISAPQNPTILPMKFPSKQSSHDNDNDDNSNPSETEDALIFFTSGTTSGAAKGVRLGQESVVLQSMAKLWDPCRYASSTRLLASLLPLYHVGGWSSALAVVLAGGALVFVNSETETPPSSSSSQKSPLAKALQIHSSNTTFPNNAINSLVVVPTMLHTLWEEHASRQSSAASPMNGCQTIMPSYYPRVKLLLVGGQSLSPELTRSTRQLFPNARLVQTYACTEAGSSICFWELEQSLANTAAGTMAPMNRTNCLPAAATLVGVPPVHVQVELRSTTPPSHCITEPNQVGWIATRGRHIMNGYWHRGRATSSKREQTESSTWLVTQDLGCWDEMGRLYYCGRASDVIRTGSESVLATEVERVLEQLPWIQECAVVGLPHDAKWGELVCAAIVLQQNHHEDNDPFVLLHRIRQHCTQQQLAGYKKPKQVFSLPKLPRNSSGKLLKHQLVKQLLTLQQRQQNEKKTLQPNTPHFAIRSKL